MDLLVVLVIFAVDEVFKLSEVRQSVVFDANKVLVPAYNTNLKKLKKNRKF